MKKELNNVILFYTEKDRSYIEELSLYINDKTSVILNFFNMNIINRKLPIYLHDNLDSFKKIAVKYHNNDESLIPAWLCGFFNGEEINTLCIEELNKTKSHENETILDLENLILHEFVHYCYNYILKKNNKTNRCEDIVFWFSEGMAITVSGQYKNRQKKFDVSYEQLMNGSCNYIHYYTMFSYILDKYGKDYILELLLNRDRLLEDTPKLYEEVISYYKKTI